MTPPLTGQNIAARIRMVSQLRQSGIRLKNAATKAWRDGKIAYEPIQDSRMDLEYWKKAPIIKE